MDDVFTARIEWFARPEEYLTIVYARLKLGEWGQIVEYRQAVTWQELELWSAEEWLRETWPQMRDELLRYVNNSAG